MPAAWIPRAAAGRQAAPTLDIDFHSQGGSLYVRDYPDAVNPDLEPDWPGYEVHVERRPDVRGTPPKAAQRLIAHWRVRRAAQVANARVINALMPGPCATCAAAPAAPAATRTCRGAPAGGRAGTRARASRARHQTRRSRP